MRAGTPGNVHGHWFIVAAAVLLAVILLATFIGRNGNGAGPGDEALEPTAPETPADTKPPVTHVAIRDLAFDPQHITVAPGTMVVWTYPEGKNQHEIVLRDFNIRSPRLYAGDAWNYTFAEPGQYLVIDAIFSFVQGTVTVTE